MGTITMSDVSSSDILAKQTVGVVCHLGALCGLWSSGKYRQSTVSLDDCRCKNKIEGGGREDEE